MINIIQYILIILISFGVLTILLFMLAIVRSLNSIFVSIKMLSTNYQALTDVLHKMFTKMREEDK